MTLSRSLTTRILHFLLLAIVIHQLIGSNFIERPLPGEDPELSYQLHTWIGIAGFVTVFAFWIWSLVRRRETSFSELIPWFSSARRQALFADIRKHVRILISFRLPDDDHSGLSSAVHGLGLLVVTAMAISGTLYYFVFQGTALFTISSFRALHSVNSFSRPMKSCPISCGPISSAMPLWL